MSIPGDFDEFYARSREQLLLETYALTGDVTASRSAVRDSFAIAWHHWRKVSRLEDPEAWARPIALGRAQRRRAARRWHRDKNLPEDAQRTLASLAELSQVDRRILVLCTLAPVGLDEIARLVGLPRTKLEHHLQSATADFTLSREVSATQVREVLEDLRPLIARTRWPVEGTVRRQGTVRRRGFTLVGVGIAAVAVIASGSLITAASDATPVSLADETVMPPVSVRADDEQDPVAAPDESLLISTDHVSRLDPSLEWAQAAEPDSVRTRCQPVEWSELGASTLSRGWTASREVTEKKKIRQGGKTRTKKVTRTVEAAQATEVVLSVADEETSSAVYGTVQAWFTRCSDERVQLLDTQTLEGVGDEAMLWVLRAWDSNPGTIHLATARSGDRTYVTSVSARGKKPSVKTTAALLATSVNRGCGQEGTGACAGPPDATSVPPLPVGDPAGLLSVVDLPPVASARGPWQGTDAIKPSTNLAASRCDRTSFGGKATRNPLSRTFLFPESTRATEFGLTQVVGLSGKTPPAKFVDTVRSKVRRCASDAFGVQVTQLTQKGKGARTLTAWRFAVEVSENRTVPFMMAIMRDHNAVSQVGFSPSGKMTMTNADFVRMSEVALERLSDFPGWKG